MKVEVREHNKKWGHMFQEEAQRIKVIFGDELIDMHHIGSTAVNGLKAKPIIDMMPVVKHIGKIDSLTEQMAGIGYESLGENGIKGRRFFRKGGETRTHHIHVFQVDNNIDIDRHLAVRDYLRTHYEDAERYGCVKEKLAKQFPSDIDSYINGKDAFVKALEKKAVHWYKDR